MEIYPITGSERAMKLQEVLLRATAGKIKWWQAAELIGISERQMHQTMLRRSPAPNSAHALLLRQRAIRGPQHLLHVPEIQPGMENSHPPRIYTSNLTSPSAV